MDSHFTVYVHGVTFKTRISSIAEGLCMAPCQLKILSTAA